MRLGVVGMLPNDFRAYTSAQLAAIAALGFTGFGCHLDGALTFEITAADCSVFKALYTTAGLDLAQFSIIYNECLFTPDTAPLLAVTEKIARGIMLARRLGAFEAL